MSTSMQPAADERARSFEDRYRLEAEPWSFSERAAESLRHEWIANEAWRLRARSVLDIGCSLGQLTARLATLPVDLYATDLSPTAVSRARLTLETSGRSLAAVRFFAGSALSLPLESGTVDLAIASDGLHSWQLNTEERAGAIREAARVVAPNGHVLFTEHLRRHRFPCFVNEIRENPLLEVVSVSYLYDRPWYQFESWLRAVQHWPSARAMRRNLVIARALRLVGRGIGPRASRHICVLARRVSG